MIVEVRLHAISYPGGVAKMIRKVLVPLLAIATSAIAKDAVTASVQPRTGPPVITTVNGNPYSVGTFAVGTIQLTYTVVADKFSAGELATFQVGLKDDAYNSSPVTVYPNSVTLEQIGGANVTLSAAKAGFSVTGTGEIGSTVVSVTIPESAVEAFDYDGATLVGNLRLSTSPESAHLDTVTNILVKVTLVHPTTECVRAFDFITDQTLTTPVRMVEVIVSNGKDPKITSMNPFGQLSDNLLVINTCAAAQSFSIGATLDDAFVTSPHGNAGNAVFTYFANGSVGPTQFNISLFGKGTAEGENLCLTGVTLPGNQTFLETIHMGINGPPPAAVTGDFVFSASLYSGSSCNGPLLGSPLSTTLTYTIKQQESSQK